jgi:UDP-N-acetylglucosamine--N-acetylmuramyl-(pentapeptide) pyrophosphoryl-undecaprenol N-acetylglucosamine transferase
MARKKRIVFTGGGTLGHVIPNLPLIEYYQQQGYTIHYIGSKKGEEREKIGTLGIAYHSIRTGKLRRYFDWQNFLDIFNVSLGIVQSFFVLLRLRPQVLFSKGGYVALPAVVAAWLLRIPIVIHESDRTPGLTTRLSKRFAKRICVSFQHATQYFDTKKVVWTGLPVRSAVFDASREKGLSITGFSGTRPILLVFGGSLGADYLNNLVREYITTPWLAQFDVVNICGKGKIAHNLHYVNYKQFEYLGEEFLDVIQAADLVLTRGGATSLFELLAMKKPHVIIPLSKAVSRGDQVHNARYFADLGVSSFIEEEDASWERVQALLEQTYQNRALLISSMEQLEFSQATQKVVQVIEKSKKS